MVPHPGLHPNQDDPLSLVCIVGFFWEAKIPTNQSSYLVLVAFSPKPSRQPWPEPRNDGTPAEPAEAVGLKRSFGLCCEARVKLEAGMELTRTLLRGNRRRITDGMGGEEEFVFKKGVKQLGNTSKARWKRVTCQGRVCKSVKGGGKWILGDFRWGVGKRAAILEVCIICGLQHWPRHQTAGLLGFGLISACSAVLGAADESAPSKWQQIHGVGERKGSAGWDCKAGVP